jgi:clan AA aspartic protease
MGLVYTDITLKNVFDVRKNREGLLDEAEVRQTTVQALVDTGAGTLIINEAVLKILGLEIEGTRGVELADRSTQQYRKTEPVYIHWENRTTSCPAVVLPDSSEVLLGAIPLEEMDLIVDPARQTLIGAHGDEVVLMVK